MPTTDPGEKRIYANDVRRHTEKIQQLAERIATYSEYLARDAKTSPADDQWAADIEKSVQELRRRMAALEALEDLSIVFRDLRADETA